ncbi:hypothetical protein MHK_002313 [Candidatus Magnetomorum sp. HK-1]|nr:hypothetical protein MHK_002313 [Candidatus Magnetomorum sp. HK-1]
MFEKQIIYQLCLLPENLKLEVSHYIAFLIKKNSDNVQKTHKEKNSRVFGSAKGKYKLSPDFNAPLDEFKEYMP